MLDMSNQDKSLLVAAGRQALAIMQFSPLFVVFTCLCHLLDQNYFGWPKFNFDKPKKIWPAKTIKILYKNEGPKSFGQPNIFLAGQKYFGQADGIGISQKKYEFIHIFHCVFSILAVLLQCMGASCFGKGMKREASTFMLSQ